VARPLPRGKLLGGCSSTNATFALRGHPADYDAWEQAGNEGWSFDEVLPFFIRLENDADFGQAACHGDGGPLPIRRYRDDELTDVAQAGLTALEQAGCTWVPDANAPGAVGVFALPASAPTWLITLPCRLISATAERFARSLHSRWPRLCEAKARAPMDRLTCSAS